MGFSLQCVAKVTVNNLAANLPIFSKHISSLLLAIDPIHAALLSVDLMENSAIVCDDEITTNYYGLTFHRLRNV
jgi:hypothetical protein